MMSNVDPAVFLHFIDQQVLKSVCYFLEGLSSIDHFTVFKLFVGTLSTILFNLQNHVSYKLDNRGVFCTLFSSFIVMISKLKCRPLRYHEISILNNLIFAESKFCVISQQ